MISSHSRARFEGLVGVLFLVWGTLREVAGFLTDNTAECDRLRCLVTSGGLVQSKTRL
jgi:hypothetical protein